MQKKIPLFSLTSHEFSEEIYKRFGKGKQHALIIYEEWFRTGKVTSQNPAFKNAIKLWHDIENVTDFSYLPISDRREDGFTGKILLQTEERLEIEAVLIPMQAGGTLCVSSQIGCRMGCAFCETGRMGLLRQLSVSEIISQLFAARFILNFDFRNVVFMGMGEPFDNYDAVMKAFRILTDSHGFGFGQNHITISTSGRVDGIIKMMGEEGPIPNLAISINAPTEELRNKLMPINRTFSLQDLYESMSQFCVKTGKEILIAYVLIKGQNDSLEHAKKLAEYLKGLSVRINLIPYNRQSNDRFESASESNIDEFAGILREEGYKTLIRQTKGDRIMAACGQLGNIQLRSLRKSKLFMTA